MRTLRYVCASAFVVVLGGCGSPAAPTAPLAMSGTTAPSETTATSTTATTATTAATATGEPITAMGKRCGRPDVEATVETVSGPSGEQLMLTSVGSGGTVALLLHQTNSSGACGWWRFANQLSQNGIRAVMLDFCGYGASTCDTSKPWAADYVDQTVRSVAALRTAGATRLTIVGASLGGTVASLSAAPAKADAVANLSGFGFASMVTGPSIAALTIPVLGGGSHNEEGDSERLQAEVQGSASPTKRFVWQETGHGWDLVLDGPFADAAVTGVGRTIVGWVTGDYSA